MSELKQFKLPDVGEGLTEADIVRWLVQPGDKITVNQIIVEIETAKAVVELPSPYEGVVADLLVPEGTTADVGTPIISVQVGAAGAAPGAEPGRAGGPGDSGPGDSGPGDSGRGDSERGDSGSAAAARRAGRASEIPSPPAEGAVEPGIHGSPAPKEKRQAVLVGYGVKLGATKRRPRKAAASEVQAAPPRPLASQPGTPHPGTSQPGTPHPGTPHPGTPYPGTSQPGTPHPGTPRSVVPRPVPRQPVVPATRPERAAPPGNGQAGSPLWSAPAASGDRPVVLAKPPVRKLAKDLGVDLTQVTGTGPSGSITREDIQAVAAELALPEAGQPAAESVGLISTAAMRLASLPREERIPIRGVRKHMAAAMAASAFTAPHVTEFLQIDITATMDATTRLKSLREFEGVRVSPLLLVAKALLVAAGRHPLINSAWDEAAQEIVMKHHVNLGIAAATERGLLVPSVKDAHALTLPELARAIDDLARIARAGKSTPADLRGGTITITNVGVFGVDTGTPIITPGEAAILAFGQVKDAPWVIDGQLAVRKVCTLALSFDHRIIDGELGSAVLREVGAMLTDPLRMLAWS